LTKRYPTPEKLASADVSELREFFQPLGLVRRAHLLINAAKRIVCEHGGRIPGSIKAISDLPGMGIYSSRAVACLAFGESVPMVDESSGRLLRRVLNLEGEVPAYSDMQLLKIATSIVPAQHAREFNLGLLDIASAFCHHDIPSCPNCPLTKVCSYYHKPLKSRARARE
jgi:A/G-specific adenine glycosylase